MFVSLMGLIGIIVGLLLTFVLVLFPLGLILRRMGHSEWWALIIFLPLGVIVGLWLLAYGRWPMFDGKARK
jgi:H+/Cl- antiporter ClcA